MKNDEKKVMNEKKPEGFPGGMPPKGMPPKDGLPKGTPGGGPGFSGRPNFSEQVDENGKKIYRRTSSMGGRGFGGPGGPGGGRRGRGPSGLKLKDIDFKQLDLSVIKRVLSYLWQYKVRFLISIFCVIGSAVISVYTSTAFGKLIDNYITPMQKTGVFDRAAVLGFILKLAVIYMVAIVMTFTNRRMYVVITQGIMKKIRDDLFAHMQSLPIRYFDSNSYGDLMSRYTNDTDTLQMLISRSLPEILSAAVTLLSSLFTMLKTSIWLTLFSFIFIFFMTKITAWITKRSGAFFMAQQEAVGSLNGFIEEMVDGQRVIKVFNYEDRAIKEFNEENDNLEHVAFNASFWGGTMGPMMGFMGNLQYVLTAIFGAALAVFGISNIYLIGSGPLTLGAVIIFLTLGRRFNMTISNVAQQMNSIVMAMAGASRIFEMLDEKPEEDDGTVTLVNAKENPDGTLSESDTRTGIWAWKVPMDGQVIYIKLEGDVRLSHVDFSYVQDKQVLYDVSLFAKPGQKVAFVGATGAGKTTITNLINRFYDIQNGDITYDGIPVSNIKKADLRRSLGVVLQEVNLFTGTIRENIRYGKLDATDDEVIAAAKLANAHDFISRLPHGYDTVIDGTGSQLSQGQRQLISIARAAIQDPPVMIMDEATSSIDTRTEILVQKGMDSLMKGRTVFVIAHRLSTVMNSDVIMVLDHGHIIERGNHDELIEQQGKYYQLYTGNFDDLDEEHD